MELDFHNHSEYRKWWSYPETINASDEQVSSKCIADQIEDGHQWNRYQVPCGHIYIYTSHEMLEAAVLCRNASQLQLLWKYCLWMRQPNFAAFTLCSVGMRAPPPADVREFVPCDDSDNHSVLVVVPLFVPSLDVVRCIYWNIIFFYLIFPLHANYNIPSLLFFRVSVDINIQY